MFVQEIKPTLQRNERRRSERISNLL